LSIPEQKNPASQHPHQTGDFGHQQHHLSLPMAETFQLGERETIPLTEESTVITGFSITLASNIHY